MDLNIARGKGQINNNRFLRSISGLALLALVIAGSGSCRHQSEQPQHYELKGKVISVDKPGGTVTVAHDAIPGYMDAMTMPFKLKDELLLDDIGDGDRLQATLVVAGLRSWLEDVVVTRETVDQANLSRDQKWIEPKPGDEVPDFVLVNQDGKRVSFHKYRGQAVVLTFIYTRCPLPDYCPLMTDNFSEIEKSLKSDPELYAKTRLLSISVDPDYDTPNVLRQYAVARSADTARWDFASGTKDEVQQVATYFGMRYWQEGDQIVHSLRTAIIAADGKLVKLYRGNDWKPPEIVSQLRDLSIPKEVGSTPNVHRGVGVIDSVDRENGVVQIDHEDIKDVMPAMNMPYAVKDKSLLNGIAPGDKVYFWLESTSSGFVVTRVKRRR